MSIYGVLLILGCFGYSATYDRGVKHTFSYVTTVNVAEDCEAMEGHRLRAKVDLTTVWRNPAKDEELLRIEVSELTVHVARKGSYVKPETKSDSVVSPVATFAHFEQGEVRKLFESLDETLDVKNIKRAILSLLQSTGTEEVTSQSDVSGNCQVINKWNGRIRRKVKASCTHPDQDPAIVQANGVRSGAVYETRTSSCESAEHSSDVLKCSAKDNVRVYSNIWRKPSICVTSESHLEFESKESVPEHSIAADTIEGAFEKVQSTFKGIHKANIYSVLRNENQKKSAKTITDLVNKYQESLKTAYVGKLKSASVFLKLLSEFRMASKENIIKILKNKKFKSIIMPQVFDVIAASATNNALKAAFETLDFTSEEESDSVERYLTSLSASPKTSAVAINELLIVLGKPNINKKIKATAVTTLGTLLRTYRTQNGAIDEKVAQNAFAYLISSLKKCNKDEPCKMAYLRGLRNVADPKSAGLLLEETQTGGKPALEAMLALKQIFETHAMTTEFEDKLLSVFNQVGRKQDRATRTIAAEILLNQSSDRQAVKAILASMSDQSDAEFSTFLASKVAHLMENDQRLRKVVTELLLNRDIGHYYSFSQKGASSLFRRQLAAVSGVNATYGTDMEMLEGGLLKRSSFDVDLFSPEGKLKLLAVGIYAEGLSSLAGDATPDEAGLDPTAGMELTVLGTALRPYVFFTGTSEAISHVWSGTASEPTPALQGNTLLTDDSRIIILNNGMAVKVQLYAVLSLDLSGAIQVSLWNRNAQTQVTTSGALIVKGAAQVESDSVETKAEFTVLAQSALKFNSDLEFYEAPFKMCVQMDQPSFLVRRELQRVTSVPEARLMIKRRTKKKLVIPGRSYALNRKNDDLCRSMQS